MFLTYVYISSLLFCFLGCFFILKNTPSIPVNNGNHCINDIIQCKSSLVFLSLSILTEEIQKMRWFFLTSDKNANILFISISKQRQIIIFTWSCNCIYLDLFASYSDFLFLPCVFTCIFLLLKSKMIVVKHMLLIWGFHLPYCICYLHFRISDFE